MQKIARELNLTETAFVLPATRSDCAARVRIFTPSKELPFAGHPTVGTAFVLLQKGIVSSRCHEFLLEEEFGPIPLRIETGTPPLIWLRTPAIHEGRCTCLNSERYRAELFFEQKLVAAARYDSFLQ